MHSVHVVAVGPFGDAVADRISTHLPEVVITRGGSILDAPPATWPVARLHVLAAWRYVPALCAAMDQMAHAWNTPWLPVVLEHPYLRVGPVVVPGRGACYTCFRRRGLQHSASPALLETLHAFYHARPDAGPRGHLPLHAELAAMAALEAMHRMEADPVSEAGLVRQIDLITLQTLQCGTMGIHGCPRCGLGRDERTRAYQELLRDINRLDAKLHS